MKLTALLLIHRYPEQAQQLIESLLSYEPMQVIVHVDAKAEVCYEVLKKSFANQSRVQFIEDRYKVFWGSFGQIQATYALMKGAVANKSEYAFLLSGQDFPIKPMAEFAAFLSAAHGKDFVVHFSLPDKQWDGGGLLRLQHFHFDSEKHPWLIRKITGQVNRLQKMLKLNRPISLPLYGGSNWFTLSQNSLEKVCTYIQGNPAYLKMFKYSRCADEIFVQSALLRVVDATNIVNNDLRMIDWSSGPEYPRIWRSEDFERLSTADNRFFARKFDASVDSDILRKLQAHVTK